MEIPHVKQETFLARLRELHPDAEIHAEEMNSAYGSWHMEIRVGRQEIHISYGPLTGFGGTDFGHEIDDANIFMPFDVSFASVEEAEAFVSKVLSEQVA